MRTPLRIAKEVLLSRTVRRNLVLLAGMAVAVGVFGPRQASAVITFIVFDPPDTVIGGGCLMVGINDDAAQCLFVADCAPGDTESFLVGGSTIGLYCPNFNPTVINKARADGVVGGNQVSLNSTSMTSQLNLLHMFQGWAQCNGTPPPGDGFPDASLAGERAFQT